VKRNIELKVRFPDLAQGHDIARSIGAPLDVIEQQRDTYFAVLHGRLKLRQRWTAEPTAEPAELNEGAFPVAQPGQLIWYHRNNEARARPSDYSLVQLADDGDAIHVLLTGALGVVVQVTKLRTVYLLDNVRIHLDQVTDLGSFLEFEAIVDQHCDDAAGEQKIRSLCAAFRLTDASILSLSYADLLGPHATDACTCPA
jgi:adenylate cyclase class 2